ncbi:AroM family protein [Roseomonas elaeocarpi]|uniref:AroM family protein n=1 Tax=Roseomonas elaeocarpi TaxID=907779 RepID=A0ABV6JNF8_9PROT
MRLGIITTGQGPRDEYVHYHRGIASALGLTIEIIDEHILEELDWPAVRPHLGAEHEARLGAHVRVPGATGNRLGDGWDHVYVRLDWAIPFFQAAIDRLVARGATAVLFCCATLFEAGAFRCPVPLILPSRLMLAAVTDRIDGFDRSVRFGVMSSAGHGRQDVQLWRDQPFADRLDIRYEPFEGDILPAARALAGFRPDVVVVWSFGLGLARRDPGNLTATLEEMLGCPVMMPHRLAALTAFGLVTAGFDDRAFVERGAASTSR